jgi:hypothetical protein
MKFCSSKEFLVFALAAVPLCRAAGGGHKEECKDHSHFNCNLIAEKHDCEALTESGNVIGDEFCQVSCGRCNVEDDQLFPDQNCYSFGKKEINVRFLNREPEPEDWVGIYPHTANSSELGSPIAWYWLCGSKKEKCKTGVGSVTFPWLPPGTYKAVLVRNQHEKGRSGPYSGYAESEFFEVVRGNTCASRRTEESEGAATHKKLRGSF